MQSRYDYLDKLSSVLNSYVDRKVRIHQTHFILESLGYSSNKISDMRKRRSDCRELLLLTEVAVDLNQLLAFFSSFYIKIYR